MFVSDIFTDSDLARIIRELSVEQEQRLQSVLDMAKSDIEKLNQHKDSRERILEMVKMWVRRTHNLDKTQLAEQLTGYFNQIIDVTPKNGEWTKLNV